MSTATTGAKTAEEDLDLTRKVIHDFIDGKSGDNASGSNAESEDTKDE
jgi:hypothetical protein